MSAQLPGVEIIRLCPNVDRRGDYRPPHNHAWCYLSGSYYLKMPSDATGVVSFYGPP